MLSKGATANIDSKTPAPRPASTVRGPVIRPFSSDKRCLKVSNERNRIAAFKVFPATREEQPT